MQGAAALLGLWGLWLATASAWGAGPPTLPPVPVVTTSTDLRALVEVVGGVRVRVESLASPLHDPHAIDVKPGALARLREASLLVRIGLDHEPWLTPLLRSLGDARFVRGSQHDLDLSKGVALLQTETPRVGGSRAHVHGFGNTHYWLDPENARPMTAAILEALTRIAPADRGRFEAGRQGSWPDSTPASAAGRRPWRPTAGLAWSWSTRPGRTSPSASGSEWWRPSRRFPASLRPRRRSPR